MSLPLGWAQTTLGEVAETKLGKMLDAAKNRGVERAYLRNVNVRWGAFDLSDLQTMRFTDEEFEALRVRDGDIFACEGGEPGRCAVWRSGPREIAYQKALHRIRPREGVDPDYLAKRIEVAVRGGEVAHLLTGTTIKHLPQVGLQRIGFALPPLAEQRRIVAKLDALTARLARARREAERVAEQSSALRLGALRTLFSWTEPPVGWSIKRIDEIGEVRLGRQRSPKDHAGNHMRPYLRAANVTWSGWDLTDVKEMNFTPDEFALFVLRDGDVLLNEGSGSAKEVGKPAVWRGEIPGVCFQNTLLRIRPASYDPELLRYCLLYMAMSGQFIASTQGVNIIHIGKAGLAKAEVPVPPVDQQSVLLASIDAAFARADRLEAEARKALALIDRLEAAILARAFRGELVPQDPNDEPASALLERIRARRAAEPKPKRGRRPKLGEAADA